MVILVLSCDRNADLFEPFHHCMEKYWPNHPEVIYKTETVKNPYYKTIAFNFSLNQWTKGVRWALDRIDDSQVLIMVDDCFIRRPVDVERIKYASEHFTSNTAMFNFEKSFDPSDIKSNLEGFKKRRRGSAWEVSIMCGLWDKEKLKQVLAPDSDPWKVEAIQNNCGYDYYINSGDYIIDWGYVTSVYTGITQGKWCRNVVPFFESEGIEIDYEERGFID